jgi:Glycosyl transferase family 2
MSEANPHSPTLAILIPSFNQPEGALESVRFIANRIGDFGTPMEVLLSDNCSDGVSYLDELEPFERAGWLRIFRQHENIGFSANVAFLAKESRSEYSMVLGCGDLPQLAVIQGVFEALKAHEPGFELLVGGVVAHGHHKLFEELQVNDLSYEAYRKMASSWAPYQEAIPGQIFQTVVLQKWWPTAPKSGNAWPHIELAMKLASSKNPAVARFSRPFVSMHQDEASWYFRPGLNVRNITKHFFVLLPNIFSAGLGVVVKGISLILVGLPSAVRQDMRALKVQKSLNGGL